MACTFCSGLRHCACHQPPTVMFFLCLLTLATTFLCFGVYVRAYPVKDADFTKDFDTVLQTLSGSMICPQGNDSAPSSALETAQGSSVASHLGNVSVLVSVTLSPWQLEDNYCGLRISATSSQLGMKDLGADPHLLLTLSSSWWSAQCNDSDADCSGKFCVTVTGPQSALPLSWSAFQCTVADPSGSQILPDLYVVEGKSDASVKCYSLQYTGDPDLKAMMSQEDCSLSSARLLMAMLFSLVVVVMFVVVTAFSIHPMKDKRTPGTL